MVGWDSGRLAMILAVLEARCGIPFAGLDVYLNVAGGMKISEPAADLDENALPVEEPASAAEATPVEKALEAAPMAMPRRSPVPPASDHPRATPDPLAPSDSATPDAPSSSL